MNSNHICISENLFQQLCCYHASPESVPSIDHIVQLSFNNLIHSNHDESIENDSTIIDSRNIDSRNLNPYSNKFSNNSNLNKEHINPIQKNLIHPFVFIYSLSKLYPSLNRKKFLKQLIDALQKIEKVSDENCKNISYLNYIDELYEIYSEELMIKSQSNRFGFRIYHTKIDTSQFTSFNEFKLIYPNAICLNVEALEIKDETDSTRHNNEEIELNKNDENIKKNKLTVNQQSDSWREMNLNDLKNNNVFIPLICRAGEQFRNVGLSIWEAQYMLLECLNLIPILHTMENSDNLFGDPNKKIKLLELGSGAGLTGVFIKNYPEIMSHFDQVILSDYQDIILQNLNYNIKLNNNYNEIDNKNKIEIHQRNDLIQSLMLDWTNYDKSTLNNYNFDLILGSDIVYDINFIEPLGNLINDLFDINSNLVCYFYITKRRESTFEYFKETMMNKGLQCDNMTDKFISIIKDKPSLFGFENLYDRESVRIFSLYKL